MEQSYYIRQSMSNEEVMESYVGFPSLFSIKLFHGGKFTKFPGRKYENGNMNYIDLLDIEKFSVHEMDGILGELGYEDDVSRYYHYIVPGADLDFGIRALGSDDDVRAFASYVNEHKVMIVYVELEITTVHTYFCSPAKVRIQEITDAEFRNQKEQKERFARPKISWHDVSDQTVPSSLPPTKLLDMLNDQDFDPFFNEGQTSNVIEHVDVDLRVDNEENEGGNQEYDDSDDDSDFMADVGNDIENVDVDLRDFRLNTIESFHVDNDEVDEAASGGIDTQVFESGSESDGIVGSSRKRALRQIRKENKDGQNFYVGQQFGTKQEAKKLIKVHAVMTRRQIKFLKDDKERLRAVCYGDTPEFLKDDKKSGSQDKGKGKCVDKGKGKCVDSGTKSKGKEKLVEIAKPKGGRGHKAVGAQYLCPWVLLVSKEPKSETWVVKTFVDVHKCLQTRDVKACTATFLSDQLMEQLQENPEIPVKAVQEQFQRKYEMGVSRMKAFRAKAKAKVQLHGDYHSQYGLLRDYLDELVKTNIGTTVRIEVEPCLDPESNERRFKRVYICLGSLRSGFQAIGRDVLGLDGCFLKGPFPGQVLTAVGIDPNNGIYPLSYAIVEAENKSSWTWFLQCIGEDLNLGINSNFTFITDRQKGIIPALETVFPCAEHRYCLRHINENMKMQWKGKLFKDMLWRLATCTTVVQFEKGFEDLKNLNHDAAVWLSKIPPKHWSRSHFSSRALTDMLLNNMCEVMNSKLVEGTDSWIKD